MCFICGESNHLFFGCARHEKDVVAKGPQYCVIDGQFIVGKAHLVPVPVEATSELSDDAQKGPCCTKHYKRIFYHSPAKAPTVHTFLGFTNDNNGA